MYIMQKNYITVLLFVLGICVMENEKETKKKLLKCAMKEFSEKGYMKASLRNICKEAGVTTGALYFFFKDKEDLFGNLVGGPLKNLEKILDEHFTEEIAVTKEVTKEANGIQISVADLAKAQGFEDDMAIARLVIHYMFREKEAFELLITKSQGSVYETMVDQVVDKVELHYTQMYIAMKGYKSKRELNKEDKFIIHWMSHDQIQIFIHILKHCKDVREAEKQLKNMMAYMIGGWFGVINTK